MTVPLILDVSNVNPLVGPVPPGMPALIAKATQGTHFHDAYYPQHRQAARDAKVPFGAYLFLEQLAPGSEADYFLDYAKPVKGDLQPIIDAEEPHVFPTRAGARRIDGCAARLEALGYKPILYASTYFWLQAIRVCPQLVRLPVWEADYPGRLTRWFPWLAAKRLKLRHGASVVLWQWTDRYTVNGRGYDCSRLFVPIRSLLIP